MTFADRIRSAQNPHAAMLVLAEGIDAVLAALDTASTPDPWAGWNVNDGGPAGAASGSVFNDNGRANTRPVVDNTVAIAAVEAELQRTHDPDDRLALEARLRLLKDDGQSVDINAPAGVLAEAHLEGDVVVTSLPVPDANRQRERRSWAEINKLHEYSQLDKASFLDAFAKGGPLWMYHTGRDEVMQMPVELRRAFIEDIHFDSPRTAHEVSRDILKDADPTATRDVIEAHRP